MGFHHMSRNKVLNNMHECNCGWKLTIGSFSKHAICMDHCQVKYKYIIFMPHIFLVLSGRILVLSGRILVLSGRILVLSGRIHYFHAHIFLVLSGRIRLTVRNNIGLILNPKLNILLFNGYWSLYTVQLRLKKRIARNILFNWRHYRVDANSKFETYKK